MNDIAFLVMDLMARDRPDLAFAFLNAYVERTGDYEGLRHLAFYAVYRALVRAMVDSLGIEAEPRASGRAPRQAQVPDQGGTELCRSAPTRADPHAWTVGLREILAEWTAHRASRRRSHPLRCRA